MKSRQFNRKYHGVFRNLIVNSRLAAIVAGEEKFKELGITDLPTLLLRHFRLLKLLTVL